GMDPKDIEAIADWCLKELVSGAPAAVRSMKELSEMADSEQVRLQASKDLLALIGVQPVKKVEVDHGLKRDQQEVDLELERAMERIAASRKAKALPEAPVQEVSTAIDVDAIEVSDQR